MPLFPHKMETRRLHNAEMKDLVRILRDVPMPTEERYERKVEKYLQYTKKDIQLLSHHLRSSRFSFRSKSNLCSVHKGLNQNLINDIWAWLRHEMEGAIGKFLYPLIVSSCLTAEQELKVRQLEPVLQMWQSDFDIDASAPPGHEPLRCGTEWHFQRDQCPACMMARVGSNEEVLFALFAGMVGRFHTKTLTTMDNDCSTAFWDKSKSKRLRFVRYWVKKTNGGDTTLYEAGALGMHMKRARVEWKKEQRRLKYSLDRTTVQGTPVTTGFRTPMTADFHRSHESERQPTVFQPGQEGRAESHQAYELPASSSHDPKLGPDPRPAHAKRLSPAEQLGFAMLDTRQRVSAIPYDQQNIYPALRSPTGPLPGRNPSTKSNDSNDSDDTVKPDDSISVVGLRPAPLHILHRPARPSLTSTSFRDGPRTHRREDSTRTSNTSRRAPPLSHVPSFASSYTITSYAGPSSQSQAAHDPLDDPIWNKLESPEDRVEWYRRMLGNPFLAAAKNESNGNAASAVLPAPKRQSMYGAFSDAGFDARVFDGVDEDVPEEELEEWEKGEGKDETAGKEKGRQGSEKTGDWENLY